MDRETLETLIHTHQAELYRYMCFLGADDSLAEDLIQDVFIAAFRSPHPSATENDIVTAAWLRGIARNLFLMHFRKNRRSRVTADTDKMQQAEEVWTRKFLRDGDGFDYVEALGRCVSKLPERQQALLDMRYKENCSRDEISKRMEMTQEGIKTQLRRIRDVLRNCIEKSIRMGCA